MSEEELGRVEDAAKHGLDPMMGFTVGRLLRDIPKRFLGLLSKLISFKGAVLGATLWLLKTRAFGESAWYVWVIIAVVVLFGREGLKFVKDLRK